MVIPDLETFGNIINFFPLLLLRTFFFASKLKVSKAEDGKKRFSCFCVCTDFPAEGKS